MGTDVVRYDIYGGDVLIANKMEEEGVELMVHVSEATKNLLDLKDKEKLYHIKTRREKVSIPKLNKTLTTYLLTEKRINNHYPMIDEVD